MKKKRIDIDKEGDRLKSKLAKSKNMSDEDKKKALEDWKKREREIAEEERKAPQSVDTLSQDVKAQTKTHINKPVKYENYEALTDDQKAESYKKFLTAENKKLVQQFGMYRDPVASQKFLMEHKHLICEHTSNYLVVWCIDLEMEEKNELMKHVASQTICMQFILELAKGVNRHPTECFPLFYQKYIQAQALKNSSDKSDKAAVDYYQAFESELSAFIKRVEDRAKVKIKEIMQEVEEEEKAERVANSPGGVDPQEVMDSLPEALANCFISRNVEDLQKLISDEPQVYMPHMIRSVQAGLWVPGQDSPLYKYTLKGEELAAYEQAEAEARAKAMAAAKEAEAGQTAAAQEAPADDKQADKTEQSVQGRNANPKIEEVD